MHDMEGLLEELGDNSNANATRKAAASLLVLNYSQCQNTRLPDRDRKTRETYPSSVGEAQFALNTSLVAGCLVAGKWTA